MIPHERHLVLIVDDDEQVLSSLGEVVARDGHEVWTARDGKQALERVAERVPCLALVDVMMPGMSGLELCARLRDDPCTRALPVIIVSGRVEADDIAAGEAAGAVDYIRKPFEADDVRLRARVHLRLHESARAGRGLERRLQAISAAAMDAILLLDPEGKVAHWNEAATAIFGYASEEAIGRDLHVLLAPDRFLEAHRAAFARFQLRGEGGTIGKTVELAAKHKAGHELPIELSLSATKIDGAWWAVGIARDVSARRAAETQLRASEERYRVLFESSRDAIMTLAPPSWRFTSGNRAALEMFRAEDEAEFTAIGPGHLSPELQPGGKPSSVLAGERISEALRDGACHFEWTHRRLDGEDFPATVLLTRVEVGGERFLQATVRDITARRRVEQELRSSERRLRAILESLPFGVAIVGRDKRVRFVNRAALALVGASREALVGHACGGLCIAPPDRCPVLDLGERIERSERSLPRADGSRLPVLKSVAEVEFDGEPVLLEAFIDLSARKALEAELGHARKLEAVGQLAAGIAHEINTPAQYVSDSVHFLKEAFADQVRLLEAYRRALAAAGAGEAVRAELTAAEAAADLDYLLENVPASIERCLDGLDRVSRIVSAMKEFAHPDQREKSPADLNRALESTLVIARNEYKYVADVETDLGPLPPVVCHLGDLNQVFLNLIVNAAHAIAEVVGTSGARGRITVRTRVDGASARIEIGDTGCGIRPEHRERVYEPFFTTKEVGKGSGQGLAIARAIVVEKHRGTLGFESEPGRGTTFTIRLPLAAGTGSWPQVAA